MPRKSKKREGGGGGQQGKATLEKEKKNVHIQMGIFVNQEKVHFDSVFSLF